jgi:queuine tRNA-ribosyltransferase
MPGFHFTLRHTAPGGARLGELRTPRGIVHTPAFMPVGTNATVKALTFDDVRALGAEIVLANTFHLYLRPGVEVIRRAGGLHRFMGWDGPVLTDSGGFQVFSLAKLRRVSDEGVVFRSPLDGGEHVWTPERVMEIQRGLGSDLIMPLDVCLGYPAADADAAEALRITALWAQRSRAVGGAEEQMLFGIVQGGFSAALRAEAADRMVALGFPGYAVGGLSVGEPRALAYALLEAVTARLPADAPRYLMGVGGPPDLLEAAARGVDMFDCVLPTRVARTGTIFTRTGRVNVRNARYRDDHTPPDPDCRCAVCARYTRAYVRHLFHADEMLGPRLATYHNLAFLAALMGEARQAIAADRFEGWRRGVLDAYATSW